MLISEFARLGQVSVRMLRHYDALGLLAPDDVDPVTGYRSYSPEQLHRLNRLVALKDLGFTLDQVRSLMTESSEPVGVEELRGMLRLRRAELEEEARAVGIRLAAVESRLRMIEKEHVMSADYVVKNVPGVRLVARTATLDPETMPQHIGPMFDEVASALATAGAAPAPGTSMATYEHTEDGMNVRVGFVSGAEAPDGCEVVELPEEQAVCGVHLGTMATIHESWQALHRWIVDNGYRFSAPCRELYVRSESEDQTDWVTELQQPVARSARRSLSPSLAEPVAR